MTIYAYVDAAADELVQAFHSLVPVVAEQAKVPHADAMSHLRRTLLDRFKDIKLSDQVDYSDDGRAALWRVRCQLWHVGEGEDRASRVGDSDPGPESASALEAPGTTLISGMPAVARWALDLITAFHAENDPGCTLESISEPVLANKLRSIRVALSHGHGQAIWRLRYEVRAPESQGPVVQVVPGSLKGIRQRVQGLRFFRADVRIIREDRA